MTASQLDNQEEGFLENPPQLTNDMAALCLKQYPFINRVARSDRARGVPRHR